MVGSPLLTEFSPYTRVIFQTSNHLLKDPKDNISFYIANELSVRQNQLCCPSASQ